MQSLILHTATRLLMALLLIFSLFLFFRGHDEPGGGFIGGLFGAGAITLYALAFGAEKAQETIRITPVSMIAWGFVALVISGILPMLLAEPFLTGQWLFLDMAGTEIKLSSPLIFDIGVYLCVVGFILAVIFSLEDE